MLEWIGQQFWLFLVVGLLIEAMLAVVVYQTGRGQVLVWMAPLLLLFGGLAGASWLVETDEEAIARTLRAGAAAVQSGEYAQVEPYLAPQAADLKLLAKLWMSRFKFREIRLSGLEIQLDRREEPPLANVTLVAFVTGSGSGVEIPLENFPVQVEARLRKQDGIWLVDRAKADRYVPGKRPANQ